MYTVLVHIPSKLTHVHCASTYPIQTWLDCTGHKWRQLHSDTDSLRYFAFLHVREALTHCGDVVVAQLIHFCVPTAHYRSWSESHFLCGAGTEIFRVSSTQDLAPSIKNIKTKIYFKLGKPQTKLFSFPLTCLSKLSVPRACFEADTFFRKILNDFLYHGIRSRIKTDRLCNTR